MFKRVQLGPHLDLTPDMFKLVRHVAHTVDKLTAGIWLKCLLVLHIFALVNQFSMMHITGGSKGPQGRAPLGSKFFQFHAVLGKIWPNNSFSHPSVELAYPPRGNSGSVTAHNASLAWIHNLMHIIFKSLQYRLLSTATNQKKKFLLSYCIFSQVLHLKSVELIWFADPICLEAFDSLFWPDNFPYEAGSGSILGRKWGKSSMEEKLHQPYKIPLQSGDLFLRIIS